MYTGIVMIGIGAYCILSEYYDISALFKKRMLIRRRETQKNGYFKVMMALGIFSITIGILLISNYFGWQRG